MNGLGLRSSDSSDIFTNAGILYYGSAKVGVPGNQTKGLHAGPPRPKRPRGGL